MSAWLRENWLWTLVNLVVLAIFVMVLRADPVIDRNSVIFSNTFEYSARWAIRLLLLSLAMTPAFVILDWRGGTRVRKSLGLWAVAFASAHVILYLLTYRSLRDINLLELLGSTNIFFGIAGFAILLALALTSNRWAMRWLGKGWKALHRWVYVAGALVTIHALWMLAFSKKAFMRGDGTLIELRIYIALFVVLMLVRVPFIRDRLKMLRVQLIKRITGVAPKVKNTVAEA